MCEIILHRPSLGELSFRQRLLKDPETMAYNHAYGGTIDFPRERWSDWYARWVEDETGERFYRCLRREADGALVGEAAYHYDGELFRRMGFRERLRTEEYVLMEKEL